MTDPARPRGVYGDPAGARAVLDALGGPAPASGTSRSPQPPVAPPRGPYRGRCGNGAHPAVYAGKGAARVLVEPGSEGCEREVAAEVGDRHNYLKLCEVCLRKYHGAGTVRERSGRDTHARMPGLCEHGLKPHQHGYAADDSPPCEFNPE